MDIALLRKPSSLDNDAIINLKEMFQEISNKLDDFKGEEESQRFIQEAKKKKEEEEKKE